jgi:hypothetical protein
LAKTRFVTNDGYGLHVLVRLESTDKGARLRVDESIEAERTRPAGFLEDKGSLPGSLVGAGEDDVDFGHEADKTVCGLGEATDTFFS